MANKLEVTKVSKVSKVSFSKENGTKVTKVTKTKTVAKTSAAGQHSRSVPGRSKAHSGSEQSTTKPTGLTVQIFDIAGKSAGTAILPKEVFGQKINEKLLAQAIRVYQANQISHTAHTKTRGEVRGGGRKPWRQKGTGNARAGSIRSPLWVGGGTTFGPRFRDVKLSLPKKMKHKALISALSGKAQEGSIKIIAGIEKISPKTKVVANLLKKLEAKKEVLLIVSAKNQNVNLATRNIQAIATDLVANLNAYEVIKTNQLLISKEALGQFK